MLGGILFILVMVFVGVFRAPTFGKGFGGVSVVLGLLGLVAAVLQMVDPASMTGAGSYFSCLIFYFVLGWKVHRVSRAPYRVLKIGEDLK